VQEENEVPEDLPRVWADRDRLDQILISLGESAIRHAGRRGRVRGSAYSRQDQAETVEEDTGTGKPLEALAHIWDRFYKVDKARTADGSGTGLGLVIVRQLVELHGGRAWVESQVGQGSRFSFSLPTAAGPVDAVPSRS